MGRELRRKQAKKEGKSLEREEIVEQNQIKKLIKTVLIILLVLGVVYLLSALFVTKELDWFFDKDTNNTETNNKVDDSILASTMFKQKESEYYVYFYDFSLKEDAVTELVNNSLVGAKVYKVNAEDAMNANYIAQSGNRSAKTIEEVKVVAPTLIKINDGVITEYYERDEIINKLS